VARAAATVAGSGDARLISHVRWMRGIVDDVTQPMSAAPAAAMTEALERGGRWLDVGEFLTGAGVLGHLLLIRGYIDEAARWHQRSLALAPTTEDVLGSLVATLGAQVSAMRGRPAEAAAQLQEIRDFLATTPSNRAQQTNVAVAAVRIAVEQGELGDVFDQAVADFERLRINVTTMWPFHRPVWVYQAFGRLAQAAAGQAALGTPAGATISPAERDRRLRAARAAIRLLGRAANGPVLRAFHRTAQASLAQLSGDPAGALRRLARIEDWANGLDLPLLGYEMARIRARSYAALGRSADAHRQASVGLQLAIVQGWHARARSIRDEFEFEAAVGSASQIVRTPAGLRSPSGIGIAAMDLQRRRLDALHQVSVTAMSVLEPLILARVALDEIVRIFGAERAFLFLIEGGDTVPYLGRDSTGADLKELIGYGSTLVDRVRGMGEPLVVTGSEEGAALGSQSALIHGLRSIMVVPLLLKARLLGVVYLDSRAARGIFTTDDVDLLTAIASQVALSLETARTAHLEAEVQAARRERDLAEILRLSMAELTATLDAREVAARLVALVEQVLLVRTVALVHSDENGVLQLAGVASAVPLAAAPTVGDVLDPAQIPGLAQALAESTVRQGRCPGQPVPLPAALSVGARAWLAAPMVMRGLHRGTLVATTSADRAFTETELQIAAVLAGQGIAALDNALLFRRVEELAVRDGLTGLFNRRHFLSLARELDGSSPMAVLMIDIDHFKLVNDSYGHSVGDEVIRTVARRLAGRLRGVDVLCRYGGEEFAVLLPGLRGDVAAEVATWLHTMVVSSPVATAVGDLEITISIGLVAAPPGMADLSKLIELADEALYDAKRSGRNRVVQVPYPELAQSIVEHQANHAWSEPPRSF